LIIDSNNTKHSDNSMVFTASKLNFIISHLNIAIIRDQLIVVYQICIVISRSDIYQ